MNIVKAVSFVAFVLAGVLVVWSERAKFDGVKRQAYVNALLLYCLLLSFGAGFTQREAWPFADWPVMFFTPPVASETYHASDFRVLGVDSHNVEYSIDYRAWQPIVLEELLAWFDIKFPLLDSASKDEAMHYLLDRANASIMRARHGGRVGSFDRILGPLTAPSHVLHPAIWTKPSELPPEPFMRLRLYRQTWNLEEREEGRVNIKRYLIYEYPR